MDKGNHLLGFIFLVLSSVEYEENNHRYVQHIHISKYNRYNFEIPEALKLPDALELPDMRALPEALSLSLLSVQ